MRAPALLGLVGIAVACGPLPPPPTSVVPINEGCPDDCADFQSSAPSNFAACSPYSGKKVCLVNDQGLSYILVVSVPPTDAVIGAGLTVVVTPDVAQTGILTVPPPLEVDGAYLANNQAQETVKQYTYNPSGNTALPVQVTFFPQYASADAASIGLPLLPIVASAASVQDPNAYNVGENSQHLNPPMGWTASVPDPHSGESYLRHVMVDPPFDAWFPADLSEDYPTSDEDVLTALSQIKLISGLTAPTSLDGWQIYVQDGASRRTSNLVTVHGATLPTAPPLFTTQTIPPQGWEVVVQPADPTMPTFKESLLGSPVNIPYPSLPPSVTVLGTVTVPVTSSSAQALLLFQSNGLSVVPSGSIPFLNYQVTVDSDPSGAFKVTLPAGHYDVTATPADPSLAKWVKRNVTAGGSLAIPIPQAATVSGKCFVADGRPLALADVVLTPAVGLAMPVPAWEQPRPIQTTTDADGAFSVPADQGTYDITIKPAAGSYLPWILLPQYPVTTTDLPITDCIVPAPVLESVTLEDDLKPANVVPFAVVRAYAKHQNGPTDPTYHEIGSGITDGRGHVDLFLTRLP